MNRIIGTILLLSLSLRGYCADELPAVCSQVYGAAADAASAATSHDTKAIAAMRKVVAPRSEIARLKGTDAELLLSLNDIVDEAFGGLAVDQLTYPVYRAEICQRRLSGKPVPDDFKVSQPKLVERSKKPKNEAIPCAMEIAGSNRSDAAA
jgi:hypothetical protein